MEKFGDRLDLFFTEDILNPNWQEHLMNSSVPREVSSSVWRAKPLFTKGNWFGQAKDSLKRYGGNIELKAITQLSPAAYEEKLLEVVLPD